MACRSLGKFFVFPNKYYLSLKRTCEPPTPLHIRMAPVHSTKNMQPKILTLVRNLWTRRPDIPPSITIHTPSDEKKKKNGAYIEKHVYIWQPLSIFLEITVRARLRPKSGQLVWQNKCLKHRQTVFLQHLFVTCLHSLPPGDLPEIMKTDSHKLTLGPGETLTRL